MQYDVIFYVKLLKCPFEGKKKKKKKPLCLPKRRGFGKCLIPKTRSSPRSFVFFSTSLPHAAAQPPPPCEQPYASPAIFKPIPLNSQKRTHFHFQEHVLIFKNQQQEDPQDSFFL
jgi:hypothetical protein